MSAERMSVQRPGDPVNSRWEGVILATLSEMPRPVRAAMVASYAIRKLWPGVDGDGRRGGRTDASTEQAKRLLDRLAIAGRIQRWERGAQFPSDLWSRGGWAWDVCEEAMYATLEHAVEWETSAEPADGERRRAARLATQLSALTGWRRVGVPATEPTMVSLQLSVAEAEDLIARLGRGV